MWARFAKFYGMKSCEISEYNGENSKSKFLKGWTHCMGSLVTHYLTCLKVMTITYFMSRHSGLLGCLCYGSGEILVFTFEICVRFLQLGRSLLSEAKRVNLKTNIKVTFAVTFDFFVCSQTSNLVVSNFWFHYKFRLCLHFSTWPLFINNGILKLPKFPVFKNHNKINGCKNLKMLRHFRETKIGQTYVG